MNKFIITYFNKASRSNSVINKIKRFFPNKILDLTMVPVPVPTWCPIVDI